MVAALARPLPPASAEGLPDFDAFYREHFAHVWRLLRRLGVRESSLDDAAQDVFLVVHRRRADFDPARSARAWVYGIALRVASDYRRSEGRKPTATLPEQIASNTADPLRASESHRKLELLHTLLEKLPDEQRRVFVLFELEQLHAPEIAELLQANVDTIYARRRAARKKFQAELRRHEAQSQLTRGRS